MTREHAIEARAEELLTVKEFARLVSLDQQTVYRRIWHGRQLGAVRVGGRWRIDVAIAVVPQCSAHHVPMPKFVQ